MTRIRAAVEAAYLVIQWTRNREGKQTVTKPDILRALVRAYSLGYEHHRQDATALVEQTLGEHELMLSDDETVQYTGRVE